MWLYWLLVISLCCGSYCLKPLNDVYGSQPNQIDSQEDKPWFKENPDWSKDYDLHRNRMKNNCNFPLEIILLYDTSLGMEEALKEIGRDEVEDWVANIFNKHPGTSVALASFRDKPLWPHGDPETDYCVKLHVPLSKDAAKENLRIADEFQWLRAEGGGDPAENHLGAMLSLLDDDMVGWQNEKATRLVVLLTDSISHFAGDGTNVHRLPSMTGPGFLDDSYQCIQEDYPSLDQLKEARNRRQTWIGFIVIQDRWYRYSPLDFWRYVNSYLGQSDDFFLHYEHTEKRWTDEMDRLIDKVRRVDCVLDEEVAEATKVEGETSTLAQQTTPQVTESHSNSETESITTTARSTTEPTTSHFTAEGDTSREAAATTTSGGASEEAAATSLSSTCSANISMHVETEGPSSSLSDHATSNAITNTLTTIS